MVGEGDVGVMTLGRVRGVVEELHFSSMNAAAAAVAAVNPRNVTGRGGQNKAGQREMGPEGFYRTENPRELGEAAGAEIKEGPKGGLRESIRSLGPPFGVLKFVRHDRTDGGGRLARRCFTNVVHVVHVAPSLVFARHVDGLPWGQGRRHPSVGLFGPVFLVACVTRAAPIQQLKR